MAASRHGNTPNKGQNRHIMTVTPYTTSVDANALGLEYMPNEANIRAIGQSGVNTTLGGPI